MRKYFISLIIFISVLYADFNLTGYIHVGDNDDFNGYIPKEPITFDGEHTYKYYLNYPTNFYISEDMTITKIELINAVGIEDDDNIKVYIDNKLVGTGSEGSNIIDVNISLSAGFHTIAIEGACYNRRGKKISCNSSNVTDIDDFYFEGYKFYTDKTNDNIKNFIQRHHIGDDGIGLFGESNDWYDDLSDDSNKPFWYPDNYEDKSISYDFNIDCNVSSIDFYLYRVRDIDYTDKNQFQFYINGNLAGYAYINTNDDGVYDLHFVYQNNITGPFKGTVKIVSGSDFWGDYDDFSWDEFIVVPHCETNQQEINSLFNAVDYIPQTKCNAINNWDNNITTKIVNKEFNLTILAKDPDTDIPLEANITKVTLYYYNSSNNGKCSGSIIGSKVICENCGQTNPSGCMSLNNIDINKAVKCVEVNIEGRALSNTSTNNNESNSTDNFAVRPEKFNITNIPPNIKAGDEFNLTIQALDSNGNLAKDYNETLTISQSTQDSPDLNWSEKNSNCITGDLSKKAGGEFKDGETNITLTYNEVGELNLTLKEINGSEFAKVDEDDTNDSQRLIKETNITITFIPHHFERNITIKNFDTDTKFTYYDNNKSLNDYSMIKAMIDLNITAENEQNKTTKNYNKECYARDIDINISLNKHHNGDINLSKIRYFYEDMSDNNSSITEVGLNDDLQINYDKNNFTTDNNGSTEIKIYFNFDRDISQPSSPLEVNISEVNVSDSNITDTNQSYVNKGGNATFYYGNIFMKDIITTKNDFNISQPILMYDDNSSDTYKPNSDEVLLDWYQNTYNKRKDANISVLKVTKGYIYQNSDIIPSSDINVSIIDINDSINIEVKRYNSNINFAVVHIIDTNASHLWYSKYGNEYNVSKGSSCVNHFCFTITWPKNSENNGVISGDTNGTKADVNKSNDTRKGVKIFR